MRIRVVAVMGLGLLTVACGTNQTQRVATGVLTGAGIGALAGGPVGAAIGVGAGAVGGALFPEDATDIANNALGREHRAAETGLSETGMATAQAQPAAPTPVVATVQTPDGLVRDAQQSLKDQNLYNGRIDGIVGPRTQRALSEYQQQQGLQQTGALDRETINRMNLPNTASFAQGTRQTTASGSSMPGGAMLSPDQIRDRLQADGYSTITSVRQINDTAYDARAMKNGTNYDLRVDARSGIIMSQHVPANGGSGSSSNTAPQAAPAPQAEPAPQANPSGNPDGAENPASPGDSTGQH